MKQFIIQAIAISGFILYSITHATAQPSPPESTRFIDIDGARLFVKTIGSGKPLVILHGGPGLSHDYLAPQFIELLAQDYQLIFYDQRASGRSTGREDTTRLNISQFVSDLEMLRQQLKLDQMNLLGHSFGGLLAMYYAVSYPNHVNKLLLLDTAPASWELNFPYFRKAIADRQTEQDRQQLATLRQKSDFRSNPELMDRYLKIYFRPFFKNPNLSGKIVLGIDANWIANNNVTNDLIWKSLGKYDIHKDLKSITSNTLILHGDASVIDVKGAEAIAKEIPNSKLVILRNVGHFPYIESPGKFRSATKSFFGK